MQLSFVAIALASLPFIFANPTVNELQARADCGLKTTYIGLNHDVKAEFYKCSSDFAPRELTPSSLERRQSSTNVCGAQCTTYCKSASGGPAQADCQVVADALLYESQNTGEQFNVTATSNTTTNYVLLQYKTCKSLYVNQATTNLTYCRSDFAGVTGWVGNKGCPGKGGICVAGDKRWFIETSHS